MGLKEFARAFMTAEGLVPLWRRLAGNLVTVQMLHRFADPELGATGASVAELRARLEFLRRHRFHLASLNELLAPEPSERLTSGPSVVFTVDDGYADFARVAAPVFAEFDCPVTVFVVTGAVDGTCWFWWDRVEFALESTKRSSVELELNGRPIVQRWATSTERAAAVVALTEALKLVPDVEKERGLRALATRLEVDVPSAPLPRYAAMSWNEVRKCATMGVTFGPHTVTHPILTNVAGPQATAEILDSWRRVTTQCDAAVPVFAYPNGAYTSRDIAIVAQSDLSAALSTEPGNTSFAAFHANDPMARYSIPRFAYTDERAQFVQTVTGVERLKGVLRGRHAVGEPSVGTA